MHRITQIGIKWQAVSIGVQFLVSEASITGLYIAIKNNADVSSSFKYSAGISTANKEQRTTAAAQELLQEVPAGLIRISLTPPIARFLARRRIVKNGLWWIIKADHLKRAISDQEKGDKLDVGYDSVGCRLMVVFGDDVWV
ncbi:hypothetical protein RJ639_012159 [Escallonia herrerae]|uniref:Uncharacterized protein n=1 Tax=Escallonia herrerae TaxID=1293975 RepID=A0AA88VLB1_9ASTE|nr:hypothetical protein RJ639_012159 [Escallonia herrerae]